MHIDQLFPSKFMRCADLEGKPMRVRITALKKEDIGGESKVVMSFADGTKQLILNKTNARSIAKALGSETKNWLGKEILLIPAVVDFKGDSVDAIRVRMPKDSQDKPASDEQPYDDELPEV